MKSQNWYKKSIDVNSEYMLAVNSGNLDRVSVLVDEAAKRSGAAKAYHGTGSKKSLSSSNQFSLEHLGMATGAASAKLAFFFAASKGTSAEYSIGDLMEVGFGPWGSLPINANGWLSHMRDIMFGANFSGNQTNPQNQKSKLLWDRYGDAIQSFLKAETPEDRARVFIDFMKPDENASLIADQARDTIDRNEVVRKIYEIYKKNPAIKTIENYHNKIGQLEYEISTILSEENKTNWGRESYEDIPPSPSITMEHRITELSKKHPENKDLKRLVDIHSQIKKLTLIIEDIESKTPPLKEWKDLTVDEIDDFETEHKNEISEEVDDAENESGVNFFTHINEGQLDVDTFKWDYRHKPDPDDSSVDEYFLIMKNTFNKRYGENYEDRAFAETISKAKNDGFDSVVFHNIRDGGGLDIIYSVFSPTQIKVADLVTYDNNGNVIDLSRRFDAKIEDYRY